jgi:hypothetical protein
VTEHRAGRIDLPRYRGRSCLPPAVQAADAFARAHLDERRIEGLTVLSVEAWQGDSLVVLVQQRGGDAWEIEVGRERAPTAVQLTCHVATPSRPWAYRCLDVRPA